ncbi:MAG TPA: hypothetical protein VMN60_09345 [Longimicrobiales bacterium]|nr:hypothetical protein [Longimicrobiales bacterium]
MRRAAAVLGAVTLALCASAASAQSRPDFSGTWTLDAEKTQAANPQMQGGGGGGGGGNAQRAGAGGGRGMGMGGGMGGGPLTIRVAATSFTTERTGQNGAVTQTFKLDGSPTQISQGQMQASGVAKWDGATVVVELTIQTPQGARVSKATYSIEGEHLVIANEQPGRDGAATVRKQYFKKS